MDTIILQNIADISIQEKSRKNKNNVDFRTC